MSSYILYFNVQQNPKEYPSHREGSTSSNKTLARQPALRRLHTFRRTLFVFWRTCIPKKWIRTLLNCRTMMTFPPCPHGRARRRCARRRFAARRAASRSPKKPSLKSLESSMSDEQYKNLFGSDSSDVEENSSDEEDVPLRDLKRPRQMSSDEVLQAAGNAHKSLVICSALLRRC